MQEPYCLNQGENGLLAVEIQIGSLPLDDRGKTFELRDQKPTKIAMANGVFSQAAWV